ncbi:MAG: DUF3592 domain-containing protein, partial [Verrucomicrobiota bacterium]
FFLGFSLPGIGITIGAGWTHYLVTSQLGWVETDAMVFSNAADGGKVVTDSDVGYVFDFEGQSVRVDGIGAVPFFTDSDEKNAKARQVAKSIPREESVSVWVNPRNPDQSTLMRAQPSFILFFLMIFAFSHGVTGLALFLSAIQSFKRTRGLDSKLANHPDNPLMWRQDWESGVARSHGGAMLWVWGYVAAVFIIIAWWGAANAWLGNSQMGVKLAFTAAAIVGLVPVMLFVRAFRGRLFSRQVELVLPHGGVAQNGKYSVQVKRPGGIPEAFISQGNWTLTATRGRRGSEDNSSDDELFVMDGRAERSGLSGLTVRFDFPGSPVTSAPNQQYTGVTWQVKGQAGRWNVMDPIDVPVLGLAEGHYQENAEAQQREDSGLDDDDEFFQVAVPHSASEVQQVLNREKFNYTAQGANGFTIESPANRKFSMSGGSILFGLIFAGFGVGAIVMGWQVVIPALMGLVFLAIGGGIALFGLRNLLQNRSVERRGDGSILFRTKMLGMETSREFAPEAINEVKAASGWKENDQNVYQVSILEQLSTGQEKKRNLLGGIRDREVAFLIAELLKSDEKISG